MKKVLCMAAMALLAVSCSDNENEMPQPQPVPANATPIEIGQTITGLTKAAVVEGSNVTATVLMGDAVGGNHNWENFIAREENKLTSSQFAADDDRANVAAATFVAGTTNKVGLNPPLYYAVNDNTMQSHLVAIAPAGRVDGQTVAFSVTDGLQDVMYADEKNAGTATSKNDVLFTFKHLTTQIKFEVKLLPAAADGKWSGKIVTVKSITIRDAKLPNSVTYKNGDVNWSVPTLLVVPGIGNGALTSTAASVGTPVMIAADNALRIDVIIGVSGESDQLYNDVLVMKNDHDALITATGSAHTVTLTVEEPTKVSGATEITTTATVTPWTDGDAGSATLK